MRKKVIIIFAVFFIILVYVTFTSALKVFQSGIEIPVIPAEDKEEIRLVLITQELDTPFWRKVSKGAEAQAIKEKVSLEVWGSYGNNKEDFLKKLDVAIHSKVDGIIVQGLDTESFKELSKVKAASYGIPIITVANDVPMEESLRKTYIGSDQFEAGKVVAEELLDQMGVAGQVIILGDQEKEYYQERRLEGIQSVLKGYPEISILYGSTGDEKEQIISTTQQLMNQLPEVDAFIAVNANHAGLMIQEIGRRSQVEPYHIYTFDDGSESDSLLAEGKLDGLLEQSPFRMGEESVRRVTQWISGETVPLDMQGYLTGIRMIESAGSMK